jgi:hypothetical protein
MARAFLLSTSVSRQLAAGSAGGTGVGRCFAYTTPNGLALDKLKPEIAHAVAAQIHRTDRSTHGFRGCTPSANQSFGQLDLYLRWRHEITVMSTLTRKLRQDDFYRDCASSGDCSVGNFRGA